MAGWRRVPTPDLLSTTRYLCGLGGARSLGAQECFRHDAHRDSAVPGCLPRFPPWTCSTSNTHVLGSPVAEEHSREAVISMVANPSFLCVRSTASDVMWPWMSAGSSSSLHKQSK